MKYLMYNNGWRETTYLDKTRLYDAKKNSIVAELMDFYYSIIQNELTVKSGFE